jgi:hypothetical protein
MTHQAVSTPNLAYNGARGTAGRAPEPEPKAPSLDEEAARLLEVAAAGQLQILKFAEAMVANPSRPGVQALTHLAWSCREEARKLYPAKDARSSQKFEHDSEVAEALEKAIKSCVALLEAEEGAQRLNDQLIDSFARVFAAGVKAGEERAMKELGEAEREEPVRRTEFVSDDMGKITGKVEYQLKPIGGKK